MYLKDRHRVEICLPAHMMLAAFITGVNEETQKRPEFQTLLADLKTAGQEPIDDLEPRKAMSILNRTARLLRDVTKDHVHQGAEVSKIALITFHFMRFIIEDEYLQYEEGSAIERCILTYMEALQHVAEEERVNASAIKQAKKMLRQLQAEGYYVGVNPSD